MVASTGRWFYDAKIDVDISLSCMGQVENKWKVLAAVFALCALAAVAVTTPISAQDGLPKPIAPMQRALDEKGISYAEWLLDQGIRNRNVEYVTAALQSGAAISRVKNIKSAEIPPLFTAVSTLQQNPEIIRLLVRAGADVNAHWNYDSAPSLNRPDLSSTYVAIMRLWGAQSDDYFVLYFAALHGKSPVETLLREGANVNERTTFGKTALFATTNIEIGEVLARHGADLDAKDRDGVSVLGRAKARIANAKQDLHPALPQAEAYYRWLVSKGAKE
jgi:hypothetical protein